MAGAEPTGLLSAGRRTFPLLHPRHHLLDKVAQGRRLRLAEALDERIRLANQVTYGQVLTPLAAFIWAIGIKTFTGMGHAAKTSHSN